MSSSSNNGSDFQLPNRSKKTQNKDTVIVGAGLAGLSIALYLSQLDPDRQITILDREEHDIEAKKRTTISSFAAAGMLAPQSERLPKGHLLDLCLASRRMYPEFCDLVESLAQESGQEGAKFLMPQQQSSQEPPWSVGYMASGGFLAPAFAGDTVATWAPPEDGGTATWLDEIQVRELEPNLHPEVVGGWWFPEDASVDARRLTCSLYAACIAAGVQFLCGKGYEVTSVDLNDGTCHGLWLQNGKYFKTKSVLVANGAWMRNLLPVPIEPHKGQSLALKMPADRPPILRRVLFAQDSYIVPKADGNIVIGATVEAGSFDGNVTPAGLLHILTHALELVPGLKDLPVVETWAGLRPTTPDKGPIIGKSPWKNLFLAGGYWRNGVLLAPKTAQLLACLMTDTAMSADDEALLGAFSWDRFTAKGGGATMAANARYAASMHPIHSRVSGAGVAAAVGTELGSYSTAKAAKDERQKDRKALWESDSDDAFERAAALGQRDALSFSMDNEKKDAPPSKPKPPSPVFFPEPTTEEKASNARQETAQNDLASIYDSIKENKAKQVVSLPDTGGVDTRPDPGFRIYHVDDETGESREVPPYTKPVDFLQSISKDTTSTTASDSVPEKISKSSDKNANKATPSSKSDKSSYNEKTYDGYQDILVANAGKSREEELQSMRQARFKNRLDQESIDASKIGTITDEFKEFEESEEPASSQTDLSSAYQAILDNKSKQKVELPDTSDVEQRPDPGFRIFHVDSETGESREVPPYTKPVDFLLSLAEEKAPNATVTEATISSEGIDGVSKLENDEHLNGLSKINGDHSGKAANEEYSEKTFDGYQDIIEANSANTREEELEAMRRARQSNRLGQSGIDDSKL
ncbi:protein ThiO/ThiG [Seminavis robusta]|uniref:Protein ThiO/ThiG n=1 Tax=Seminavis robusta TaxID=568900 RepID=A0A9N8HCA5_9STRA|nr:protein ThiO/ThiG [Seminavis robusta]|eukprot:Sro399_g134930.1 protein ThiO/ThiG (868) ;mRNA; f:53091-55801